MLMQPALLDNCGIFEQTQFSGVKGRKIRRGREGKGGIKMTQRHK